MQAQALHSLLAFVAVVALIPIALWLLRRTPIGGASAVHGGLRTVAMLPLSTSQRIVTVEVGEGADRRWLVLGVTPSSIVTLHTLPPQADAPAMPAPTGFGQILERLRAGPHAR
jgi:flagellar protein FliO/FliZ